MKVNQHIEKSQGKPLFSFEILPPLKGQNIQSIFDSIDPLMEFNPPFIDVTYHREEYEYKEWNNSNDIWPIRWYLFWHINDYYFVKNCVLMG